jgi:6-phosphogluconate dehydrogenase
MQENPSQNQKFEIAIIGLGKMGGNLALQAIGKNIHVVGLDPTHMNPDLVQAGLSVAEDYKHLAKLLTPPRKIFLYVPAGDAVDSVMDELVQVLQPGDIIADGGNSYWGDSKARYEKLKKSGINFIDLGTSGGPEGALRGACFMAGGEAHVMNTVKPILDQLSIPGGFVHAGPPGAGHFTKLVHNGIEFGMMQAIGEGLDLLENYEADLDIESILQTWRRGTVIRSWLIELLAEAYKNLDELEKIPGYVEDTGEVNWLIEDAAKMQIPIPVIAQSVWQLMLSRDDKKIWAKAIAAMRHSFGGHPFGRDDKIANYRETSRSHQAPAEQISKH